MTLSRSASQISADETKHTIHRIGGGYFTVEPVAKVGKMLLVVNGKGRVKTGGNAGSSQAFEVHWAGSLEQPYV